MAPFVVWISLGPRPVHFVPCTWHDCLEDQVIYGRIAHKLSASTMQRDEEKWKELEKSRKYKNEKHKRGFHLSWKESFRWLEYHITNEEEKMFWNTCRRYDGSGSFSVENDEYENDDNFRAEEEEAYKLLTSMFSLLHMF